jgi:hypothetical protein
MKIGVNGIEEELPEEDKITINKALYYAVRETHNNKLDESKTEIIREALDIMKSEEKKPVTSHMCNISLDDFFRACEVRGWTNELYEIAWLRLR